MYLRMLKLLERNSILRALGNLILFIKFLMLYFITYTEVVYILLTWCYNILWGNRADFKMMLPTGKKFLLES